MHDLAFADAARPRKVVVLGVPLMPYTIGHEILLCQAQSPLIYLSPESFDKLGDEERMRSVASVATICSRTWREANCGGMFIPKVKIFGPKVKRGILVRTGTDWESEIKTVREYLEKGRYLLPPPDREADHICSKTNGYSSSNDMKGRSFGAPLVAQMINFCLDRPGLMDGAPSVYDMPFALIASLYFAHLEVDGSVRIENQEERDIKEKMARIRDAVEKKNQASKSDSGLATPPPKL